MVTIEHAGHYVGMDEQAVTEEVFAELTSRLVPQGKEKKTPGKQYVGLLLGKRSLEWLPKKQSHCKTLFCKYL